MFSEQECTWRHQPLILFPIASSLNDLCAFLKPANVKFLVSAGMHKQIGYLMSMIKPEMCQMLCVCVLCVGWLKTCGPKSTDDP